MDDKRTAGLTGECEFCGRPKHYGFCDEMRAECERQAKMGKPVPNPHVRHG